jgi:hypothetical protein
MQSPSLYRVTDVIDRGGTEAQRMRKRVRSRRRLWAASPSDKGNSAGALYQGTASAVPHNIENDQGRVPHSFAVFE